MPDRRRLLVVLVACLVSAAGLTATGLAAKACAPPPRPPAPARHGGDRPLDIVLIVTDDQRADTVRYMPNAERLLAGHGVTFSHFYVTTSLCCPARAGILTGQYSHHTGVLDNIGPHGGAAALRDSSTLATWLFDAGYDTGLVGKYLNGYSELGTCYVPPGWSRWEALATEPEAQYYDYSLNDDGHLVEYGHGRDDYSTTVLGTRANAFVRSAREPFFLYLAPSTPHRPATRLPRDRDRFASLAPARPPSFDERDLSDKPWASPAPRLNTHEVDAVRQHMLESLQALDRSVAALVRTLRRSGRLSHTVIMLTSDNGFLWGEHRLVSKVWPYEESIRVPLVVRVPWIHDARTDDHLALNIDLAPTIADLAGVRPQLPQDGRSLVPLLRGTPAGWRHQFVVEWLSQRPGATAVGAPPPFSGLHTRRYVYVEYENGWRELYDLRTDPYELENLVGQPGTRALQRRLSRGLRRAVGRGS